MISTALEPFHHNVGATHLKKISTVDNTSSKFAAAATGGLVGGGGGGDWLIYSTGCVVVSTMSRSGHLTYLTLLDFFTAVSKVTISLKTLATACSGQTRW